MAAALFTLVCDYRGGTYVAQVYAPDHRHALISWAELLKRERALGERSAAVADAVIDANDDPVRLTGLTGVWCWSATVGSDLALTHIIGPARV